MYIKHLQEYMADELVDRIRILQTALNQAEKIVSTLEKENKNLKDALLNLALLNNEDLTNSVENFNDRLCEV